MTQRYVDPVNGSDANTGLSSGSPWKTIGKVYTSAANGDTVDIIGSSSRYARADMPMGTDVFFGDGKKNNLTIRNYPDTHVQLSAVGRGASHSGFTWERWTAGGITVQGSGSVRVGPMDANDPTDGSYRFGVIQLNACSGMLFDGGPDKQLILNGGGCDYGMYMGTGTYSGTLMGCTDMLVRNYESLEDAGGILVKGGGTLTAYPVGGRGVVIERFDAHDHRRMLDARGTSDVGAHGISTEQAGGVVIQDGRIWNNYAVSPQYGYDGGAIIPFGSPDLTIRRVEMWDCAGFIETGRNQTDPYCSGMSITHCRFRGRANPFDKSPSTDPALILRDFNDGLLAHNTFYLGGGLVAEDFIIDLHTGAGGFNGPIDRVRILNNIFVYRDAGAIPILSAQALPTGANAPTIDYNLYYRPGGGTIIGQTDAGTYTWANWPAALVAQGVFGAEAHGKNTDPLLTSP